MQELFAEMIIDQMLHFTWIERLLDITHFQLSRLFREQCRAEAVASLIINAYKRRSVLIAQNADVASTTVGVTYLRSMKHVFKTNDTCALYARRRHICA